MNIQALYQLLIIIEQGGSSVSYTHNRSRWGGSEIPHEARYLTSMGYLKFMSTAPAVKRSGGRASWRNSGGHTQRNVYRVTPAGHAIVAKMRTEIECGPGGRT